MDPKQYVTGQSPTGIFAQNKSKSWRNSRPAHIVTMSQDMDVDNDLGDVSKREKADPPKQAAKK